MGGMNTSAPIEIFKPGKHKAMNGAVLDFSESDLQATVSAYDPAVHEAPIVVGHPKLDAPAYGWVKSLAFADDGLVADSHQVDPEFAEMVNAGRFKKVSASFFAPDSPRNPVPGVFYLRHVGFLGAMPPAVKGLKQVEFSESEEGVVEFSSYDDMTVAKLFRRLREFLIGDKGAEVAERVLPDYQISSLEIAASEEMLEERMESAAPTPQFSEPESKGDEMSADDKARLAVLEEENARLRKEQADFAEAEAQRQRDAAHADHVAFAEGLVKAGKLLPGNKAVAIAALDLIAAQEVPLEFGEGDEKAELTVDGFKATLSSFPKVVDFGEHAAGDDAVGTADFAAPEGYAVDTAALETHRLALAHQSANPGTSYIAAVEAVKKGV